MFGNLRAQKRLDRFTLRGRTKVNGPRTLFCLGHTIEQLTHAGDAAYRAPRNAQQSTPMPCGGRRRPQQWTGCSKLSDRTKQALRLQTDRPSALREAIEPCRPVGGVSIPEVNAGIIDKMPTGSAFSKCLTLKMGQPHTPKYIRILLEHVLNGDIDPGFTISHLLQLDEAPGAHRAFNEKSDRRKNVVLNPASP